MKSELLEGVDLLLYVEKVYFNYRKLHWGFEVRHLENKGGEMNLCVTRGGGIRYGTDTMPS